MSGAGWVFLSCLLLASSRVWAVLEGDSLPDLDRRSELSRFPRREVAISQQAAAGRLLNRVPQARVEFDADRHSPLFVRNLQGFLTGPRGVGQSVPVAAPPGVAAMNEYRAFGGFLMEHAPLFGHGAEVIQGRSPMRAYTTPHNGLRSVVWDQQYLGLPVWGSVLIAHQTAAEELVSVSSTWVADVEGLALTEDPNPLGFLSDPPVSGSQAVLAALGSLGMQLGPEQLMMDEPSSGRGATVLRFRVSNHPDLASARLTWVPMHSEEVALCWQVEVTRTRGTERYQVLVNARSGELVLRRCLTVYEAQPATFLVFTSDSPSPFSPAFCDPNTNQPSLVARSRVTLSALSTNASPLGWIGAGENQTLGNNVDAHLDLDADNIPDLPRPQGSPFREFAPFLNLSLPAENNRDAAVVQLFYWCNVMHDRLYELGFTEAAGNFQKDNLGRGGQGGDPILADAQDGSGVNNANFTPSDDGESGRIQMYVFDGADPSRDGDLDAEIILHEYTHGLSTRLVGGGVGITTLQAGGLGEGWSDFYALSLLAEPTDDPDGCYAMGGYVTRSFFGLEENYTFGIRRYPYTTDLTKNPLILADIDPQRIQEYPEVPRNPVFPFSQALAGEVHNQGEVWCVTLWGLRSAMIHKYGFEVGQTLTLRLVTDGMKLSPPNPSFLQARDAILQADWVTNQGKNQDDIWRAFARRGMGFSAVVPLSSSTSGVQEAFDLPDALAMDDRSPLIFIGSVGGPFYEDCRTFQITNQSAAAVSWSVGQSASWVGVEPSRGLLAPYSVASLQVCLNARVMKEPVGRSVDSLWLTNESSGVIQSRVLDLRVMQFTTMPFSDDFEETALRPEWLVSNPPHGRVQITSIGNPHSGKTHVTMDSNSDGLPARNELTLGIDLSGWTNVVVRFWAKEFSDEPNPPPPSPFLDGADFDGVAISVDGRHWYEVQSLRNLTETNQEFVVSLDSTVQTYGLAYGPRWLIRFNQFDNYSIPLDGIAIDDVHIDGTPVGRYAIQLPDSIREGDSQPSIGAVILAVPALEDVVFHLSLDPPDEASVSATTVIRKGEAKGEFLLTPKDNELLDGTRSLQVTASAPGYFGDPGLFSIEDNETASLSIWAPGQVREGAGHLEGAALVEVDQVPARDLTIRVKSSDPAHLTVPSTLIIPEGETAALLDLNVPNGKALEGPVAVVVTVEVAGWSSGAATVVVQDNDSPTLRLTLPNTLSEGNPPFSGTVTLGGTVKTNVVVKLTSEKVDWLQVPSEVEVKAGSLSADFDVAAVDDALVQGARVVHVSAEAVGFDASMAEVIVLDDETPPRNYGPSPADGATNQPPRILLSWHPGFGELMVNGGFEKGTLEGWHYEGDSPQGFVVNDGNVNPDGPDSPSPPFEGDYNALLAQDAPGRHRLWQEVELPADCKSAQLSWVDFIHNHGTEFFDPTQQYQVQVTDPSGKVLEVLFTTRAGDPLSTEWTNHLADLTRYRGQKIRVQFSEQDELGYINVGVDNVSLQLGTTGETSFQVLVGTRPELSLEDSVATTSQSSFLVSHLLPNQNYFWQVLSLRGEARNSGPVWTFSTRSVGQLDHFEWTGVPDVWSVAGGVQLGLSARDEFGLLVTNYQGTVDLQAVVGAASADTVLITEVDPGTDDGAEFSNVGQGPVDLSGWKIYFYDLNRWPDPKGVWTAPPGLLVAPGATFRVREGGKPPGLFPDFRIGTNINWGFLSVGQPVAVLVQDAQSNLVDFVAAVDADPTRIRVPMSLPPSAWSGAPLVPINSQSNTWQRIGHRDSNGNQDWQVAERTIGRFNPGMELPFQPNATLPLSVNGLSQVTLDQGLWEGAIQLKGTAPALTLRASDTNGHWGLSSLFAAAVDPEVQLVLLKKPASVALDQVFQLVYAISNASPVEVSGGVFVNQSPGGLPVLSTDSNAAECGPGASDGETRCQWGPLKPGETLQIALRMSASQSGTFTNQCRIEYLKPQGGSGAASRMDVFDCTLPFLIINDTTVDEGNSGIHDASFLVRLSAAIQRPVSVQYDTSDDGATAGSDYVPAHGTLVFAPGTTNAVIKVGIIGDQIYEVQERFSVTLTNPVNAVVGRGVAKGSIREEEQEPQLTVGDVRVVEGNGPIGAIAVVPVFLSVASSGPIVGTYFTADDTAHAISDYVSQRGVLSFPPGVTQQVVRIPIVGDLRPETEEQFFLWVTNLTGARIAKDPGLIVIQDDDASRLAGFAWSAFSATQIVDQPFSVTLKAVDQTGAVVPTFQGSLALRAFSNQHDVGPITQSNVWGFPLRTYFHDARGQFLYPSNELGGTAGRLTGIRFHVTEIPGQSMKSFTVRLKQVSETEWRRADWENEGLQSVYQGELIVSDQGWFSLPFQTPFTYDGQHSLLVDLSFDNSSYTSDGLCFDVSTLGLRGRVFESDSAFGNPTSWSGTLPPASLTNRVPELRFDLEEEVPLSPGLAGPFVAGVWQGELSLAAAAPQVWISALEASGLEAVTDPFAVETENGGSSRPRISGLRFLGPDLIIEFFGDPDRGYQLEASGDLLSGPWVGIGQPVGGSVSGVQLLDAGGALHPRRFYRIRQLP